MKNNVGNCKKGFHAYLVSQVGNIARLLFYYPFAWFVVNALPVSAVLKIARAKAVVWGTFMDKKRKNALLNRFGNLKKEFHFKQSARQLFLDYLTNHVFIKLSPLMYGALARTPTENLFVIKNRHHLDRALKKKRGAVLTTAHFGPSMLLAFWAGENYHTGLLRLLYDKREATFGHRLARNRVRQLSEFIPVTYIDVQGDLSAREKLLSENGLIVQTGDGASVMTGIGKLIPVPFLARRVLFAKGPFSLAYRTKALVVPYFVRLIGKKLEVTFYPALDPEKAFKGDKDAWIQEAAALFASDFEAALFTAPGTWQLWELFESQKLIIDMD
ncbi:MAG: hypothetical protein R6U68_03575 [Desulfobacteraceae bacterium]